MWRDYESLTTSEAYYPPYDFNISSRNEEPTYKISLKLSNPETFVRIERYGRGGHQRAAYRKVREMYVDQKLRIFAGFEAINEDRSGTYYEYALIGNLQIINPNGKEAVS